MSEPRENDRPHGADEFERQAAGSARSFLGEYLDFVKHERKWWLVPLLLVLLLAGGLIVLKRGST